MTDYGMAFVRNLQIWADRNGNNNQIYGDDISEKKLYMQKLDELLANGQISKRDHSCMFDFVTDPLVDNWQISTNKNAKNVLEVFKNLNKDDDFETKAAKLKQVLGNENVSDVMLCRSPDVPIAVILNDGTQVSYNKMREELKYKTKTTTTFYYLLDTGEFMEEIKKTKNYYY